MFRLHESDKQYRNGDSGPKYLMQGPRMNFAVMRLKPGENFNAHYHGVMEENFYVLEGELEVVVDGRPQRLGVGDFIHVEPKEIHYLRNPGAAPVKFIAALSPYQQSDKTEVENYTY